MVLKGGTALNLFVFDVPRLSVDIDLNYVGAEDRDGMLAERPKVEQAVQAVFARERALPSGGCPKNTPEASGRCGMKAPPAGAGNLEVDINFMFRVLLWPVVTSDSHSVGTWRATGIPVLDRHELAAGKLGGVAGAQTGAGSVRQPSDSPNGRPRSPPPSHRIRGLRRDEQEGLEDGLRGRCGLRRHGVGQAVGSYAARRIRPRSKRNQPNTGRAL
ncbi:MAG: nucleotidyl transferase AbiEii/AbiGii toxin family protein [Desulfobacterales bacterium]|nr:nucleotidyl transferase AbiEii/AbiGii toxin family protein [Desulfobacterales bacterium]